MSETSLRTRRFQMFILTLLALTAFGVLALVLKSEGGLALAIMGSISAFGGAALGLGNWHDKAVRTAEAAARPSIPPPAPVQP